MSFEQSYYPPSHPQNEEDLHFFNTDRRFGYYFEKSVNSTTDFSQIAAGVNNRTHIKELDPATDEYIHRLGESVGE